MKSKKKKIAVEVEVPDGATHSGVLYDGAISVDEYGNYYWWMFDGKEWSFWVEVPEEWVRITPSNLNRLKPIEVIE